ncbi:SurA N-terminal domain-containing protein [bacterium]|nr:SurA N-terminal domain-containing protein [bacterium]
MMKKILLSLFFLFPLFAHAGQMVDKIVATVDNKVITQSEVDEAYAFIKSGRIPVKNPNITKTQLIEELINRAILNAEIEKQNITVTSAEIDNLISSKAREQGMTVDQLKKKFDEAGIKFELYRERAEEDIKRQQFMQKVIMPKVKVSDYDLEQYYKAHSSYFMGYGQIRFLEMFLTPMTVPAGKVFNTFVQETALSLQKGASWSELAKKYSQGAFASKGGDSGLVDTATLKPGLLQILTRLPQGKISDPIPMSGNGVFIFKVLEKGKPTILPFLQVKEAVRDMYFNGRVEIELQKYLAQTKSYHFVNIKAP